MEEREEFIQTVDDTEPVVVSLEGGGVGAAVVVVGTALLQVALQMAPGPCFFLLETKRTEMSPLKTWALNLFPPNLRKSQLNSHRIIDMNDCLLL